MANRVGGCESNCLRALNAKTLFTIAGNVSVNMGTEHRAATGITANYLFERVHKEDTKPTRTHTDARAIG